VRDVKVALAETDEKAAAVLTQRESGRCGGRWRKEKDERWGWKEQEARWKDWQAQVQARYEQPSAAAQQQEQAASKLV
jgi:hypothetical protein